MAPCAPSLSVLALASTTLGVIPHGTGFALPALPQTAAAGVNAAAASPSE